MKKLYSKKKNELKKVNRSGNSREAVEKAEQEFKALAFLSWIEKHLQLRDTKNNLPKPQAKLPEEDGSFTEESRTIASSNHSLDGYTSSDNENGLTGETYDKDQASRENHHENDEDQSSLDSSTAAKKTANQQHKK